MRGYHHLGQYCNHCNIFMNNIKKIIHSHYHITYIVNVIDIILYCLYPNNIIMVYNRKYKVNNKDKMVPIHIVWHHCNKLKTVLKYCPSKDEEIYMYFFRLKYDKLRCKREYSVGVNEINIILKVIYRKWTLKPNWFYVSITNPRLVQDWDLFPDILKNLHVAWRSSHCKFHEKSTLTSKLAVTSI